MESTSSISGLAAYSSVLDDGHCEGAFRQDQDVLPEKTPTQPIARRPIDLQCSDSDPDGGVDYSIDAVDQGIDNGSRFDDGGEFGSPRTL